MSPPTVGDLLHTINACLVRALDRVGVHWMTVFKEELLNSVSTPERRTGYMT